MTYLGTKWIEPLLAEKNLTGNEKIVYVIFSILGRNQDPPNWHDLAIKKKTLQEKTGLTSLTLRKVIDSLQSKDLLKVSGNQAKTRYTLLPLDSEALQARVTALKEGAAGVESPNTETISPDAMSIINYWNAQPHTMKVRMPPNNQLVRKLLALLDGTLFPKTGPVSHDTVIRTIDRYCEFLNPDPKLTGGNLSVSWKSLPLALFVHNPYAKAFKSMFLFCLSGKDPVIFRDTPEEVREDIKFPSLYFECKQTFIDKWLVGEADKLTLEKDNQLIYFVNRFGTKIEDWKRRGRQQIGMTEQFWSWKILDAIQHLNNHNRTGKIYCPFRTITRDFFLDDFLSKYLVSTGALLSYDQPTHY